MFDLNTAGRRGTLVAAFALLLTTAACGSETALPAGNLDAAVPGKPAVVQPAPYVTSADAAERRGAQQEAERPTVPGRRVPDPMP